MSTARDGSTTPTLDAPVPARAAPAPSQEASPPGILPHHLADLRRSGLSDAIIKASRVFSEVSLPKVKALLETKSFPSRCLPALVFPFADAEGRNGYCRLRVDHPRTSGGKAVRYESPRGQANQILSSARRGRRAGDGPRATYDGGRKKGPCGNASRFPLHRAGRGLRMEAGPEGNPVAGPRKNRVEGAGGLHRL